MGSDGGLAVTRPGLLGAAASARPAPWASVGALGAGADGATWAASASGSTMGCCRRRWEGTVALATRRRGVVQGRSAGAAEGRGHRLWPEHVEAVRGDLCTCAEVRPVARCLLSLEELRLVRARVGLGVGLKTSLPERVEGEAEG